jgi:DNA-binding XRE family transcriptional regulator
MPVTHSGYLLLNSGFKSHFTLLTAKGWRKGVFMRPFCHLVIKAIRVDSPPCKRNRKELAEALRDHRSRLRLVQGELATRLGVSLKTLKNWERGRTRPAVKFWPGIRALLSAKETLLG